MAYQVGDYVYPGGLPQRLLCRVAGVEQGSTRAGSFQILTLEPLEGPLRQWAEPALVRLDEDVQQADTRDLWRAGSRA
jgi:hypothetical protein